MHSYIFTSGVLTTLLAVSSVANAHSGEEHRHMHAGELAARQLSANTRHVQARQCAAAIAEYTAKRKARRSLNNKKRQETTSISLTATASGTSSAWNPTVTAITNNTCITAPEVTEGPYYIRNEMVRQDLREDQQGVDLTLDIGVMDTTTCTPLTGAFVELWNANATGIYGGFITASMGGGGGGSPNMTQSGVPTGSMDMTRTGSSAMPTGSMSPGGGGGGGGTSMSDDSTFLRGGWPTDGNGIVEFLTKFPGFYSGRTVHMHMMVHTNYTTSKNGTIVSDSGSLVHIGQLFFDQNLADQVFNTSVYLANTNPLTTNDEDGIFAQENADGNNAIVDAQLLGATIEEGLFGYITVGVNASALYSITTTNYHKGDESSLTGGTIVSSVSGTALQADATTTGSTSGSVKRRHSFWA